MRAIQITEFGGPEVLRLVELPDPVPGPGEVLIEVSRAGVNYADTHQAENSYLSPAALPMVPGGEVVGRTPDGRRVVAMASSGGYAEKAVAPEHMVWDVPEEVDDVTALGLLVQGVSAWVLLRRSVRMEAGESVVVHAAAGGVGSLAVQLAKIWGAGRVIATASSPAKRELALRLGADAAVDPAAEDLTAALIEANEGRRVDAVLEMTGGPVTDQSLRALAPFGRLAFYGMASRKPPSPVRPEALMAHSTTVAGMWLAHVFRQSGDLARTALEELYALAAAGRLQVIAGGEYPLSQARKAHEDLRARRTTGKLVLDPSR
ncbi:MULTISPECIES: quinone oxidoreductase family protein [Thermomonospora]|uniref:Alcohol dehydrogenase zinc-binding domain protein n=1 Tax=Thermomonospora curvata (strain ATCC 19995 / DSM 43183 / JCM 3096 / KCTC 9072 / NBRC 15933 / NCIMB 10081 / Henssen B9) TaxID=471852 RepID=D1AET3_THECD|nr:MULTISPECIES: zinc-binding dehydrogenase [Thermomonospora]ACY97658.1 Alcohol dehydrogenase zinc-binding domain protein [Thermomonospora curvata DSM 43183]PKK14403.1 MAG: NADPH:quinone reductase [Thermomonospora sp. CIF 1]